MNKIYTRELVGGALLFFAAVLALIVANSPLSPFYNLLLDTPFEVRLGDKGIDKPLLLWINDGLMAVFFLLIALEVKREFLEGELSSPSQIALPAIGAVGGMLLPAIVYSLFNFSNATYIHGWAIPTATDIAFVLGVLAILGPRVPTALRMFLLSLAIFDDIAAIAIIAVFYSHDMSLNMLLGSMACLGVLAVFNRLHLKQTMPYVLVGIVMWLFVLKSGIHATLAGVALGLMIPHKGSRVGESPLKKMEYTLHPYVVYGIVPIFAFTNAGVSLVDLTLEDLAHPVTMGVALGLFVGKQVGILGFCWLAIKLGFAKLPRNTSWPAMYGGSILCGIGFTMSLFIASLAFTPGAMPDGFAADRLGILLGSLTSGIVGYLILRNCHAGNSALVDESFVQEYTK
jgi:NhaA family Na+:H+ antiporter